MLKALSLTATALTLAACTTLTSANNTPALALLDSDTTRVSFFSHDARKTLTAGSLTLGDSEHGLSVNRSANTLQLTWRDSGWAGFEVEFRQPRNVSAYQNGAYVFDLEVQQFNDAGFDFARLCANGCERRVSLTHQVAPLLNQGQRTVAVPMACVLREHDTLIAESAPLRVATGGSGKISLSNIRIEPVLPQVDIVFSCPDYKTAALTPAPLDEHWAQSWWLPRHQQKLAVAAATKPRLVFIGDSITQGWEEAGQQVFQQTFGQWPSLNLGFSGDRTENVLWRLEHGALEQINPELVVLMIGTNNTGHRQDEPALIARGVAQILTQLERRLPDAKVLLLTIFPRGASADDYLRRNNSLTNARLRNLADGERVLFADLNSVFLDKDGNLAKDIMPDFLHPNERGYQRLGDALRPLVQPHMAR